MEEKKKSFGRSPLALVIGLAVVLFVCLQSYNRQNGNGAGTALSEGLEHLSASQYEEAESAFLAAMEEDPENEEAYLGLARAYIGMEQPDRAIRVLNQGLASIPDSQAMERLSEELMTGDGSVVEEGEEPWAEETPSHEESASTSGEDELVELVP